MKKLLAVLLVGMLVLTGCSKGTEAPAGETVKIGTGIVNSVKTADAGEKAGKFESNVTFATVTIKDDKIETVSIDTAQNAVEFTAEGINEFVARKTKKELGDDYGMSKAGKVEWDKQVASLEEYLVGKSITEIKADKAAADLTSTVSITVDGYIDAVNKAIENAVEVKGLAKVGTVSAVGAKTEDPAKVEINTTVTSVGLDADGKVVYAFADESQLKAAITGATVVAGEELRTKGQQGKDYGMSAAGKTEWNEQIATLVEWAVGKDLSGIEKADVTSSVSIYHDHIVAGLVSAIKAAK